MKRLLALALLLGSAACGQDEAPAEKIAQIVRPSTDPSPVARGRFAPRDTCGRVDGADEFRAQLAAAIYRRDTEALVELAASDIKLDFGGGDGEDELRKRLEDPTWRLWAELEALMELGCSANRQGGITMPWFFDQNLGNADPFSTMLVTGEGVPVLEAPDADSAHLASVSWDLVKITGLNPEGRFQQVELPDGTVGFVESTQLRSPIAYRLIASRRNERWRITTLVAGD